MPRLSTSLLLKAYQENTLLPLLLKECRSLDSARNELRWLRERALRDAQERSHFRQDQDQVTGTHIGWRTRLRAMCHRRSQGVPLQYLLGDQPFGDLEILCRRGVLIPRSDTESYTYEAARLVRQMALETKDNNSPTPSQPHKAKSLRILDLCTGTGCMALLLHALLASHFDRIQITGVDISPIALNLARRNLEHNIRLGGLDSRARVDVEFHRADVLRRNNNSSNGIDTSGNAIPTVEELLLSNLNLTTQSEIEHTETTTTLPKIDLLISNPPYISSTDFHNGTTARSVRLFEPKLALVPPIDIPATTDTAHSIGSKGDEGDNDKPEDIFYRRILELSLDVRARITVLECGDRMQAERVVGMVKGMNSSGSEGDNEGEGGGGGLKVEVWPDTEEDCLSNGFHVRDGSRCVIVRRGKCDIP
ncbi:uncharacterized protein N7473_013458 [Penicillium subrubescens]|uniref:uncharacterized protein n=1 Tax=Penicillium subrubescens TaxID=1316194 RepID=UPI00254595A5|nr:uncharacterized protein N7473_013458 [Penicillium subrubescens]KAJ5873585.1 hypothetical protein N7473_013458 [Penicillium subrubescens]